MLCAAAHNTYIATWEGGYLATVIDLASRRVVGWALADHMRTELVNDALEMAFVQRRPPKGAIFHSDRGNTRVGIMASWRGPTAWCSRSAWRGNAGTTPSRRASSPPSSAS